MADSLRADSHILIILMGSLGDVVRGLSLPAAIKSRYPQIKISWLVEPACSKIVRLNRHIDQVIVFNRAAPLRGVADLRAEFKNNKFDIVLDLQRHFKSGFFSWLSGGSVRIGFHPRHTKEFNHLFNNSYIENLPGTLPKIRHYWNFLEKFGIEPADPPDFGFTHISGQPEQQMLVKKIPAPFVGVILGSSWESKDWPVSGYAALIAELLKTSAYHFALLGDKSQTGIANQLAEHLGSPRVHSFAGSTGLEDLVALIDKSEFCLGPDSGPGHIAGAMNKPYISLFGPTSPELTAPFGSEDLVIQKRLGCIPCYRRKCPGLDKLCMRLISPSDVIAKINSLDQRTQQPAGSVPVSGSEI